MEIEKTEFDSKIRIETPEEMQAYLDEEEKMLREMVNKVKDAGVDVVFCQKGIDDVAVHFLAKEGVLAVKQVKDSDMEKLAKATGGKLISNLADLSEDDLGSCGLVEGGKIGDDRMVFVEECRDPRSVAIFIRAGLERMLDEAERSLNDALYVISDVAELPKIVSGGGSVELELAKAVRDYAPQVGGREQLAIEAFAEALEIVPRTLEVNAGLDVLDTMVDMKAAHVKPEGLHVGVTVFDEGVVDMLQEGVLSPW